MIQFSGFSGPLRMVCVFGAICHRTGRFSIEHALSNYDCGIQAI